MGVGMVHQNNRWQVVWPRDGTTNRMSTTVSAWISNTKHNVQETGAASIYFWDISAGITFTNDVRIQRLYRLSLEEWAYLCDLKVIRSKSFHNFLVSASLLTHGGPKSIQHTLKSELLHFECTVIAISIYFLAVYRNAPSPHRTVHPRLLAKILQQRFLGKTSANSYFGTANLTVKSRSVYPQWC